jgi:hypothetical protein
MVGSRLVLGEKGVGVRCSCGMASMCFRIESDICGVMRERYAGFASSCGFLTLRRVGAVGLVPC